MESFKFNQEQSTAVAPLLAVAQQVGVEVRWNLQGKSSMHVLASKKLVITMSIEQEQLNAAACEISLATALGGTLAHELGHAFAYLQKQNFLSETFAWEVGLELVSKVYGCIPEDVIKLGEYSLSSYEAVHGDMETAELYMAQQFSEFIETTGF